VCVRVFRCTMHVAPHRGYSCTSHITKLNSCVATEPWTELAADAILLKFVVVFICCVDP